MRRFLAWLATGLAALALLAALGGLGAAVYVQRKYLTDLPPLPARERLYAFKREPAIRFYDRTGRFMAARGPRYGERVRLDHLPTYVPLAMLAAEDRRFYEHGALDLRGIARAYMANRRAGRIVEGGSTISQQLAKTLFLSPDQTFKRKVQEAVLAVRLERMLSKDEVLELYLNRIYFGANTFGLDGAARTYFGKPASQLTLAEAALLAAVPKAPTRLALNHGMDAALERSRLVLGRMRREGWISAEQERAAAAAAPRLAATADAGDGDFGWALDYATGEAIRMAGPDSPDLLVRLTIDPRLQETGVRVLRRTLERQGRALRASEGALVALDEDGAIRAMVGGVDYSRSVFNRAVQARRQPGSSFKPFVYAAALEKGVRPGDVRVDAPIRLGGWSPENYGGGHLGAVTVQTALTRSINTVAVRLAQEVGGEAIGSLARRFGFTTIPARPGLSVALGAYEVSLLEMTGAFQVFQKGGERVTPHIIEEVRTVAGERVLIRLPSGPVPAYDQARAGMMLRMMQGVMTSGTGTRANFGWPAAGKTGTSQNWRDAWFVGFTPAYVAGVWIGNDDGRSMRKVTGGETPALIWRQFMIAAHQGLPMRDFDWLGPAPPPAPHPDLEADYYDSLAAGLSEDAAALRPAYAGDGEPPPDRDDDYRYGYRPEHPYEDEPPF